MKINNRNIYRSLGGAICAGAFGLMASSTFGQNLFVSSFAGGTITEVSPSGGQTPFASGLDYPFGIAFDSSGNLFVANTDDNSFTGGSITEYLAGGGTVSLASGIDPLALTVNSQGDVFAADYKGGEIYEFTPGGTRTTIATGFDTPLSLAFDPFGNLYVSGGYGDGNGYIDKVTGGTGTPFVTGLSFPAGIVFNGQDMLFVSSQNNGTISEYNSLGVGKTFATVSGGLNGLAFDSAGFLYAAGSGPIYKIAPDGSSSSTLTTIAGTPTDLAFQPVPEPSVLGLVGMGAGALLFFRRKQIIS